MTSLITFGGISIGFGLGIFTGMLNNEYVNSMVVVIPSIIAGVGAIVVGGGLLYGYENPEN